MYKMKAMLVTQFITQKPLNRLWWKIEHYYYNIIYEGYSLNKLQKYVFLKIIGKFS